jgi:hypothetical protein
VKSTGLLLASWGIVLFLGLTLGFLFFSGTESEGPLLNEPFPLPAIPDKQSADPEPTPGQDEVIAALRAEVAGLKKELAARTAGGQGAGLPAGASAASRSLPAGAARTVPSRLNPQPMSPNLPKPPPSPVLREGFGGIEGYVLEPSGQPAKGIRVHPRHEKSGKEFSMQSDALGFYRFVDLEPGYYWMETGKEKSPRTIWPVKEVSVYAGKITRTDFGGASCANVKGIVRDAQGAALKGAHLELKNVEPGETKHHKALTDSQGRFVLGMVEPGAYNWDLVVHAEGEISGSGRIRFLDGGPFFWELTLEATGLDGIVVDSKTGMAVADADVTLWPQGGSDAELLSLDAPMGKFRFQGIEPCTYQIRVYCEGYAYFRGPKVRIEKGQFRSDLRLALQRAVKVKVRVRDISDLPVKRFKISWFLGKTRVNYWLEKRTKDGLAEINDIGPGTYTLVIRAKGYRKTVTPDLRLTLGLNPTIEIVLEKE